MSEGFGSGIGCGMQAFASKGAAATSPDGSGAAWHPAGSGNMNAAIKQQTNNSRIISRFIPICASNNNSGIHEIFGMTPMSDSAEDQQPAESC